MKNKNKILTLISQMRDEVLACCQISMDSDDVDDKLTELEKLIQEEK